LPNLTVYRAGQSTQLSICVCIFLFCLRHVTGRVGKCCPLMRLCETLTVCDYVCLTIIVESSSKFIFSSHYKRIIWDVCVNAKRERKISVNRTFIAISRDIRGATEATQNRTDIYRLRAFSRLCWCRKREIKIEIRHIRKTLRLLVIAVDHDYFSFIWTSKTEKMMFGLRGDSKASMDLVVLFLDKMKRRKRRSHRIRQCTRYSAAITWTTLFEDVIARRWVKITNV